jgi:hypothetical protein
MEAKKTSHLGRKVAPAMIALATLGCSGGQLETKHPTQPATSVENPLMNVVNKHCADQKDRVMDCLRQSGDLEAFVRIFYANRLKYRDGEFPDVWKGLSDGGECQREGVSCDSSGRFITAKTLSYLNVDRKFNFQPPMPAYLDEAAHRVLRDSLHTEVQSHGVEFGEQATYGNFPVTEFNVRKGWAVFFHSPKSQSEVVALPLLQNVNYPVVNRSSDGQKIALAGLDDNDPHDDPWLHFNDSGFNFGWDDSYRTNNISPVCTASYPKGENPLGTGFKHTKLECLLPQYTDITVETVVHGKSLNEQNPDFNEYITVSLVSGNYPSFHLWFDLLPDGTVERVKDLNKK